MDSAGKTANATSRLPACAAPTPWELLFTTEASWSSCAGLPGVYAPTCDDPNASGYPHAGNQSQNLQLIATCRCQQQLLLLLRPPHTRSFAHALFRFHK